MRNKSEAWQPEVKARLSLSQILVGTMVGGILGVATTIFSLGRQVTSLEEQVAVLKQAAPPFTAQHENSPPKEQRQPSPEAAQRDKLPASQLEAIVQQLQRSHVKLSYGEAAYEAFTDEDLNRFVKDDVPGQVKEDLKHNNTFISVLLSVQDLTPVERQRLLKACLKPLHPTWAQLGRVGPGGQTEAGQRAEILVAGAVVELARELLRLSPAELRKLFD
jgi:hypothetical protein